MNPSFSSGTDSWVGTPPRSTVFNHGRNRSPRCTPVVPRDRRCERAPPFTTMTRRHRLRGGPQRQPPSALRRRREGALCDVTLRKPATSERRQIPGLALQFALASCTWSGHWFEIAGRRTDDVQHFGLSRSAASAILDSSRARCCSASSSRTSSIASPPHRRRESTAPTAPPLNGLSCRRATRMMTLIAAAHCAAVVRPAWRGKPRPSGPAVPAPRVGQDCRARRTPRSSPRKRGWQGCRGPPRRGIATRDRRTNAETGTLMKKYECLSAGANDAGYVCLA